MFISSLKTRLEEKRRRRRFDLSQVEPAKCPCKVTFSILPSVRPGSRGYTASRMIESAMLEQGNNFDNIFLYYNYDDVTV